MPTRVLAPLPGEGVEEITVTKWLKREGESVKESEPLLEANTDKVDIEGDTAIRSHPDQV